MLSLTLTLALIAATGAGCSFEKAYDQARLDGPPRHPSVLGPWTGQWISEQTGHYGRLRIVVKHLEESGKIRARVEMQRGALVHEFVAWLEVQPTQEALQVKGAARKGIGAGQFDCDGVVTADIWSSSWRIAADSGRFRVERPDRPAPPALAPGRSPPTSDSADPAAQPEQPEPAPASPEPGD